MWKRALLVVAATTAVAAVLAFTVSPISPAVAWSALTAAPIKEPPNTPAPRTNKKALKILRADVMTIAHDYSHKHFRAVCSDLTRKERKHLGGTKKCVLKIALIHAFVPVKKFTITTATVASGNTAGAVSLYVNRNKKHVVNATVKWEGGAYRLDHESGWHPKI
jgi:hypothetical protein